MSAIAKEKRNLRRTRHSKMNSVVNTFSPPSTSSSEEIRKTGKHKGVTVHHNQRLINEIIDGIFDEQTGTCDVSSSYCSSIQKPSSEHSFDRRLEYWKNMLNQRKLIAEQIKLKTGKEAGDILFNRKTTIDNRDTQTVKRLLDYADRLNPVKLSENVEPIKLNEYVDPSCRLIKELRVTLPKSERDKRTSVEISGLPQITRDEILGKRKDQGTENKSNWLKSKVLEERIKKKREDIERVIEFYPDLEHLQVIGKAITKN